MRMMTGCTLISQDPKVHEVGAEVNESRRRVKCQEMGLTQAELYQSGGDGMMPEAKLLIPYDRDYKGERILEYRGERWRVIRTDPYKEYNGVVLMIRRANDESVVNGNA